MESVPRVYSATVNKAGEWEPKGQLKGLFIRIQGKDFYIFCSSSQRFFSGVIESGPLVECTLIEGALKGTSEGVKVCFCFPKAWRAQIGDTSPPIWATTVPCELREVEKMEGLRRVLGFSHQIYRDAKKKQGELRDSKQNALTESEEIRERMEKEEKEIEEKKRKVVDTLVDQLNDAKRRKLAGWDVSIEEALKELKRTTGSKEIGVEEEEEEGAAAAASAASASASAAAAASAASEAAATEEKKSLKREREEKN